jgi:hypothetical protein
VDPKPVTPGRQMLAFLCLPLSLLLGIAAVAGLSELRPTINSTDELRLITERPVLGSVTLVVTPAAGADLRKDYMRFAAVGAVLLICQIGWTTWLVSHSGF